MSEQDEQGHGQGELADRLEALRADDPAETENVEEQDTERPAEPEPGEPQDERPAEGYDPHRQAWLKTYSLGTAADLHSLSLQGAAAHQVTAALPDGAARSAQEAGYRPAGAPELIDVRRNGAKTDLTYAVPTDPRG